MGNYIKAFVKVFKESLVTNAKIILRLSVSLPRIDLLLDD